jgi:hypothetical protein
MIKNVNNVLGIAICNEYNIQTKDNFGHPKWHRIKRTEHTRTFIMHIENAYN